MENKNKILGNSKEAILCHKKIIELDFDSLVSSFKFLSGRLKTIIDATISEPNQNKALKDLISQEIWQTHSYIYELSTMYSKTKKKIVEDTDVR